MPRVLRGLRLVVGSLRDARGESDWLLNWPAGNGNKQPNRYRAAGA